ncbi:MAG: TOBE domain-containing protein [Candidatus Sericytochromatia bacterium]
MNRLDAIIKNIESQDDISLISLKVNENIFSSVVINSNDTNYSINDRVIILFKETEVSIAKNFSGQISIRNKINSKIKDIKKGKILSKVMLDIKNNFIESIITTKSLNELDLKIDDEVIALIKTNEITIMKA